LGDDPVYRLGRALTEERTARVRAGAVAAFLGGCVFWRLSPLHEPEPLVGSAIMIASLVFGVAVLIAFTKHDEATLCTDELILTGYVPRGGDTPIARAVAHRVSSIESRRRRHRLASSLRWRVALAEGRTRPSPGYTRAAVLPPLCASERRVLLAERDAVNQMVARLEHAPTDPQALVILWSVVQRPPGLGERDDGSAGAELEQRLHAAAALMSGR
jgi:hypothetical protein